jgi:hypothetical protein
MFLLLAVKVGAHSFQKSHEPSQDLQGQRPLSRGMAAVREGRRQTETTQCSGITEEYQPRSLGAPLLKDLKPFPCQRMERVGHDEEVGFSATFRRSMDRVS